MKTPSNVLARLAHTALSLSCLLATAVLLVSGGPAHARSCGADGQGPCDGGGDWYIKGTCPFCAPWYHSNPDYCTGSNTLGQDGRCHAPKVPPPPPCRADCQAKKINDALGNPLEPSNNNSARVSRKDADIADSEFVHIDVGGEGSFGFQTRCDGYEDSVNLNPDSIIREGRLSGQPIPNRVPGYAQNLPFSNAFADKLSVDVRTFDATWAEEMARVIKPHGTLTACGVPGVDDFEAGIHQLLLHGLHITSTNNAGRGRKELVLGVPPDYVYTPAAVPDNATCSVAWGSGTRGPRQGQPCVVDMMVVYTAAAFQEVKNEDIVSLAQARVDMINTVSRNSRVNLEVRLIYVGPTAYDETARGGDVTRLLRDMQSSSALGITPANAAAVQQLHALRDALGADLVSVLATGLQRTSGGKISSTCGVGAGELLRDAGFSLVRPYCNTGELTPTSMAHEVGHNFGLQHSRYTIGRGPNYDPTGYNYGYVDVANKFFTVMAYPDQCRALGVNCDAEKFWSSPTVRDPAGHPVGTPKEDNARALLRNAPLVAAYNATRPAAPLLHPNPLAFGNVLVNTDSPVQGVGLYNLSSNPLTLAGVTLSGSSAFTLKAAGPPAGGVASLGTNGLKCEPGTVIPAHQSCGLWVGFRPPRETAEAANLRVSFQGGAFADLTMALTGTGFSLQPKLTTDGPPDFGLVEVGSTESQTLTLTNEGTGNLTISRVTTQGDGFSVSADGIDPDLVCKGFPNAFTLPPDQHCLLTVSFHPTGSGNKTGVLTIQSDDPQARTTNETLTGIGTHSEL